MPEVPSQQAASHRQTDATERRGAHDATRERVRARHATVDHEVRTHMRRLGRTGGWARAREVGIGAQDHVHSAGTAGKSVDLTQSETDFCSLDLGTSAGLGEESSRETTKEKIPLERSVSRIDDNYTARASTTLYVFHVLYNLQAAFLHGNCTVFHPAYYCLASLKSEFQQCSLILNFHNMQICVFEWVI